MADKKCLTTNRGKSKQAFKKVLIATYNVRGLTDKGKQEELGKDCERLKIDIMAVQETKIKYQMEKTLKTDTN